MLELKKVKEIFWATKARRVLTLLFCGLLLVLFFRHHAEIDNGAAGSHIVLSSDDLSVAKQGDFTVSIPISGELFPVDQTTIIAKVSAEAQDVYVREGEPAKKDQLLAQLNTSDLQQILREKEAALASAEASYQFSLSATKRYKKLLEKKYYSQNDYDIAVNQRQINESNVKQAKAVLAEAQLQLKYASIRSTLDGVVSERNIDPGMNVSVGQTLFKVVNLQHLELRGIVPADQISRVNVGRTVSFHVDGISQEFSGKIMRINPSTIAGTRAYYAYIAVDNADDTLKNGMFATGGIILEKQANTIIIPLQAVHYMNKKAYVYKISAKNQVQKQIITLGLTDLSSNKAQVLSGLAGNTLIISSEIEIQAGSFVILPVGMKIK